MESLRGAIELNNGLPFGISTQLTTNFPKDNLTDDEDEGVLLRGLIGLNEWFEGRACLASNTTFSPETV